MRILTLTLGFIVILGLPSFLATDEHEHESRIMHRPGLGVDTVEVLNDSTWADGQPIPPHTRRWIQPQPIVEKPGL